MDRRCCRHGDLRHQRRARGLGWVERLCLHLGKPDMPRVDRQSFCRISACSTVAYRAWDKGFAGLGFQPEEHLPFRPFIFAMICRFLSSPTPASCTAIAMAC
jgi:hypothetical protein